MKKLIFLFVVFGLITQAHAERYYYEGDGCLNLKWDQSRKAYKGCFRKTDGSYDEAELKKLNAFFNVPADLGESFSLRTLSWLDYLEDKFSKGPNLVVNSGYRSPKYNEKLRKKGALAGKTSYHLEAMAVDVTFPGVQSEIVWEYAKSLNYGGAGYYRSKAIHLDSGKPRSWIPETAVDAPEVPALNKNIAMSVDRDIYASNDSMRMFFSGVSNHPFGLKSTFKLYEGDSQLAVITPKIDGEVKDGCIQINSRAQGRNISWQISNELPKNQKLHFKVEFLRTHLQRSKIHKSTIRDRL
jgi:uncharacterized protein YcbK (DUF882 family)